MGSIPYGAYELGTLWVYRTVPEDMVWQKMLATIDIELTHSRGGYAWHRTAHWLRPSNAIKPRHAFGFATAAVEAYLARQPAPSLLPRA